MNTLNAFSKKALYYDLYRWDYAPEALLYILSVTHCLEKTVADIGAGTGIMSKHFLPVCKHVFSIEPNDAMFSILSNKYHACANWTGIQTTSDATGIQTHGVDLIVAAQAVHWFDALPTQREFRRILKRDGYLVFTRNYSTNKELGSFYDELQNSKYWVGPVDSGHIRREKPDFYYQNGSSERRIFPFEYSQTFECFLGSLLSASSIIDEGDPLFNEFVQEVKKQFDRMSQEGLITMQAETEVWIGKMEEE